MTPKLQQMLNSAEISHYLDKLKEYHLPTYNHSVRVAEYVEIITPYLPGIYHDASDDLIKGALLHDIGKLKIPCSILTKDAAPAANEWKILKQHPTLGYLMIREDFNVRIQNCVLYHHEKFDGSGYPYKLSIEVPKEASIIAICDMYDAMTTDRAYRPAMTHEATMELLYADAKEYKLDSSIIDILAGTHTIMKVS